jgi:hypothetical protein
MALKPLIDCLSNQRDVKYTASNQKALDLLCGDSQCTPVKLVTFIGNNKYAPFTFNLNVTDSDFYYNETTHIIPKNSTAYKCSEPISSANYNASACGCSDCKVVCPSPPTPDNTDMCHISGIQCFSFGVFALYIALFLLFLFMLILYRKRTSHTKGLVQITSGKMSSVNCVVPYGLLSCLNRFFLFVSPIQTMKTTHWTQNPSPIRQSPICTTRPHRNSWTRAKSIVFNLPASSSKSR